MRRTTLLLAGALVLASPTPSSACLNGVEPELVTDSAQTRRAERLVRSGHLRRGFRLAGRALDRVKLRARRDRRRAQLEPRLLRVLAVSTVRLEGRVTRRRWRTPRTVGATARRANVNWARGVLADLAMTTHTPVDRARWAEALVALGQNADAVRILAPLASEDLMPDAYGYAALARAHHALGHADEAAGAARTCRGMVRREHRGICPSFGTS